MLDGGEILDAGWLNCIRKLEWDYACAVACIDLLVWERSRPLTLDDGGIKISVMDLSDHSADCVADVMDAAYDRGMI